MKKAYLSIISIICFLSLSDGFAATSVSQFGITWTFDRDYTVGQFANGDWWVVGPVTITKIEPVSREYLSLYRNDLIVTGSFSPGEKVQQGSATGVVHSFGIFDGPGSIDFSGLILESTTGTFVTGQVVIDADGHSFTPTSIETRTMHGSMINPSPSTGINQGFDTKLDTAFGCSYNSSLNAARPNDQVLSPGNSLVVQPNSSLVSTIGLPYEYPRTPLKTAAILTVLDNPAPEGGFRPPYSGSDKTIRFNEYQLNYSVLAELPITAQIRTAMPRLHQQPGDARTWAGADSVERAFERPWFSHVSSAGGVGRAFRPFDNSDDYDRDLTNEIVDAALMLNLDYSQEVDFGSYGSNRAYKETLLVRFIQVGIDFYGIIQNGGRENFQQDTGGKLPILFAGLMLNNENMKNIGEKSGVYAHTPPYGPGNPPPDLIRFEEDDMIFYVSQADVDLTHSPQWDPDYRDVVQMPYEQADIGMPEWGKVWLYDNEQINKYWDTVYRGVIGPVYDGYALTLHIMNLKDLWNQDAFLDYTDRYMELEGSGTSFTGYMWDTYRANYGCIWRRYDPNDIYSNGYNPCTSTPPALKGDLNKDGKVNIQDVQACVNHISGKQDWGTRADVNGDGKVDEMDVREIMNIILGE